MSFHVVETTDTAAAHALRRVVFIDEQGFSEDEEWDDLDAGALQLLVMEGDTPVATARLLYEGADGRIGRICVLKDYRGHGLGALLVRHGIDHFAAQDEITQVVLGAQVRAQGFYEKLGFAPVGDVYDDGGVPHQEMVRQT
jgi:ElaA protein